jgi:hypothetical protein
VGRSRRQPKPVSADTGSVGEEEFEARRNRREWRWRRRGKELEAAWSGRRGLWHDEPEGKGKGKSQRSVTTAHTLSNFHE